MNNELYHWKYIKREKKGDKWVYTYDNGSDAKKNYNQAKNNLNTRNAQERSAMQRNLPSGGTNNVAYNNYSRYRYSDKGVRDKLEKSYKEAKFEYSKSPIGKKENRAENTKRNVEKVKNWAKDILGFDEKQAAESARTKATISKYELDDTEKKNREWRDKYVEYDRENDKLVLKPGYENVNELADWQDNYYRELSQEAENDAKIAESKYRKTPLGIYEITSEKINAAAEKGKDRIKYKIGYLEKGKSEGLQKDVEYYRAKMSEVEAQIDKTKREHPDHKGSLEYDRKRLKEYETKLNDAIKSRNKAKSDYMDTPLAKLSKNERVYEFVDNLLNGASKKRKK